MRPGPMFEGTACTSLHVTESAALQSILLSCDHTISTLQCAIVVLWYLVSDVACASLEGEELSQARV